MQKCVGVFSFLLQQYSCKTRDLIDWLVDAMWHHQATVTSSSWSIIWCHQLIPNQSSVKSWICYPKILPSHQIQVDRSIFHFNLFTFCQGFIWRKSCGIDWRIPKWWIYQGGLFWMCMVLTTVMASEPVFIPARKRREK